MIEAPLDSTSDDADDGREEDPDGREEAPDERPLRSSGTGPPLEEETESESEMSGSPPGKEQNPHHRLEKQSKARNSRTIQGVAWRELKGEDDIVLPAAEVLRHVREEQERAPMKKQEASQDAEIDLTRDTRGGDPNGMETQQNDLEYTLRNQTRLPEGNAKDDQHMHQIELTHRDEMDQSDQQQEKGRTKRQLSDRTAYVLNTNVPKAPRAGTPRRTTNHAKSAPPTTKTVRRLTHMTKKPRKAREPAVGRRVICRGPEGCNANTEGKAFSEAVMNFAHLTEIHEDQEREESRENSQDNSKHPDALEEILGLELAKLIDRAEAEVRFHREIAGRHAEELMARDRQLADLRESQEALNIQLKATQQALKKRETSYEKLVTELNKATAALQNTKIQQHDQPQTNHEKQTKGNRTENFEELLMQFDTEAQQMSPTETCHRKCMAVPDISSYQAAAQEFPAKPQPYTTARLGCQAQSRRRASTENMGRNCWSEMPGLCNDTRGRQKRAQNAQARIRGLLHLPNPGNSPTTRHIEPAASILPGNSKTALTGAQKRTSCGPS
eukprot:IDg4335t1